jgi:hypothetical protein
VIKYLENQNKLKKEQFTSVIKYVQNEQECKKQNHSILFWRNCMKIVASALTAL